MSTMTLYSYITLHSFLVDFMCNFERYLLVVMKKCDDFIAVSNSKKRTTSTTTNATLLLKIHFS